MSVQAVRWPMKQSIIILTVFAASCGTTLTLGEEAKALYPKGKLFPLVMMAVPAKDFAEVKEAGFNAVHIYDSSQSIEAAKRYLEQARRHGLKVMQNMPSKHTADDPPFWNRWIKELAPYENLAWWYLPEETVSPKIQHIGRAAHDCDPRRRPRGSYIPWNSEERLASYRRVFDLIIKSSYPTYYKEPRVNVVSWVTNVKNVAEDVPVSIACAELFGAGERPTPHDLRFDLYAAIVAGSRGMVFYKWSGGATARPDLLKAASRFAWEIAGGDNPTPLGRVILSADVPQRVKTKVLTGPTESPQTYYYVARVDSDRHRTWPSLLTLERRYDGHLYLFVVNTAQVFPGRCDYDDATVRAAFVLPAGEPAKEIDVLFEDRTLPVNAGRFEDTLDELDVRIYRWASEPQREGAGGTANGK